MSVHKILDVAELETMTPDELGIHIFAESVVFFNDQADIRGSMRRSTKNQKAESPSQINRSIKMVQ